MASSKRNPSFDIPDAVRQSGQSGWVYRSGTVPGRPKTTRPSAPLPQPPHHDRVTAVADVAVVSVQAAVDPPVVATTHAAASPAAVEQPDKGRSVAGWLVGLGLQIAVVPLVIPLYLLSGAWWKALNRYYSPAHLC